MMVDETEYRVIEQLFRRPSIYGIHTVREFLCFINGYNNALEKHFLDDFKDWFLARKHGDSSIGNGRYADDLTDVCNDRLSQLRELYEEFLETE